MPKNLGPIGGPNVPGGGNPRVLRVTLEAYNGKIAHVTYSQPVTLSYKVLSDGGVAESPMFVGGWTLVSITQCPGNTTQLLFTFKTDAVLTSMSGSPWEYQSGSSAVRTRVGNLPIQGLSGVFP